MILVIESLVACVAFSLVVIPLAAKDPLGYVSDYPPAIRERCIQLGLTQPSEHRFTRADIIRKGIAMVVFALLFALLLRHVNGVRTFAQGFVQAYIIWLAVDWWDALVIDCICFCHWRRLWIPGTEDMLDAYHDYGFHIRQSCIGMALGLPACALVGLLVAIL